MSQVRSNQLSSLLYARKVLSGTNAVPAIDAMFYREIDAPLKAEQKKILRRRAKQKNK